MSCFIHYLSHAIVHTMRRGELASHLSRITRRMPHATCRTSYTSSYFALHTHYISRIHATTSSAAYHIISHHNTSHGSTCQSTYTGMKSHDHDTHIFAPSLARPCKIRWLPALMPPPAVPCMAAPGGFARTAASPGWASPCCA